MRLPRPWLASLISLLLVLPFLAYVIHSPGSFEAGFLHTGIALAETGRLVSNGEYPPGIPLIYAGLTALFGTLPIWLVVGLNALLFAIGAGFWFRTVSALFAKQKQAWTVWTASLLNPYFLWLIITSKDTAFEWLGMTACVFLISKLTQKDASSKYPFGLALGTVAAFCFSMLVRATTVFVLLGTLIVAIILSWKTLKKILLPIFGLCVLCAGAFVLYNGKTYGSYSLSTTLAMNVGYGQSPLYEYVHPVHDIDVFLPPPSKEVPTPRPSALTFVAVSVRKSVWYWLNFEKVPNLSANTRLVEQTPETITLAIGPIQHTPSLLYTLMKLVYVPAFLLSLFLWIRRRDWTDRTIIFLVPLAALWPVCVLTFPDTRFKIVGEVLAVAFIGYQWMKELRREEGIKTSS